MEHVIASARKTRITKERTLLKKSNSFSISSFVRTSSASAVFDGRRLLLPPVAVVAVVELAFSGAASSTYG